MGAENPRILIIYAAPGNLPRLKLDWEHSAVGMVLREVGLDPSLVIKSLHATTIENLVRALVEGEYEIVQFSGHGAKEGIFLEDPRHERDVFVPARQIAQILRETSPRLKVAIFMSCYSAEAIEELVDSASYLLTVAGAADDRAAIQFVEQFYAAYLRMDSIEKAFSIAQKFIEMTKQDTDLNATLSRRAVIRGEKRVLYKVVPANKNDSILLDLTEAENDIAALNITRDNFLGMLSRKIRIHRWIFSSPRQRVVLSIGSYFGIFSWEDANDVVLCNRILRIRPEVDEYTCGAWASLIVSYNDHFMDPYRMKVGERITTLKNSLKEYQRTYESFFNTGEKADLLRKAAPEQFKVTKAIISSNLELAESKLYQEDDQSAVVYLEAALSAMHDLIDNLTNLLTR